MIYRLKDMAKALPLHRSTIRDTFIYNSIYSDFMIGYNKERFYTIYKLEILKNLLEKKNRKFKLEIDYNNLEVYVVYESKVNLE